MGFWSEFWELLKWRWQQGYIPPAHQWFSPLPPLPVPPRPALAVAINGANITDLAADRPSVERALAESEAGAQAAGAVIDLGSERRKAMARSKGDCRKWTPLDALKETVAEIESGKLALTNVMILGVNVREDGTWDQFGRFANVTRHETIALLELFKYDEIKDWVG